MRDEIIIRIKDVTKKFNSHVVLNNVSLDIPKGKAITFIGHNGTGKSTFLKIIAKLITANAGSIDYLKDINISYIPEQFPKLNLSAEAYLTHMGLITGLKEKEAEKRSSELMDKFFMKSMKETKLKHLSKGTLQKVSVIQALLVPTDVLMLDEPLSGQDIDSQNVFIRTVNELRQQGMTVIMSCHEKFLINRLSDIIYEIKDGQLIWHEVNSKRFFEYDTLVFDISKYNGTLIPKNSDNDLIKVSERYGNNILNADFMENSVNLIKLTVESSCSNGIVADMIHEGAVIKEMYHENI